MPSDLVAGLRARVPLFFNSRQKTTNARLAFVLAVAPQAGWSEEPGFDSYAGEVGGGMAAWWVAIGVPFSARHSRTLFLAPPPPFAITPHKATAVAVAVARR